MIQYTSSYGHKTILTGEGKKNVTVGSSTAFNILVLTKDMSNYTFNPNPCWRELITAEEATGDVNFDESVTAADVVLLQKCLAKKQQINKAIYIAGDMNDDDKLNVFDLIILKRQLLNS